MKKINFWGFIIILFATPCVFAQVPPPPVPVVETDMRNNTIRMRSNELERIKREADKLNAGESTKEREIKFAEIKGDFEQIQKLQDSIIRAYTTGAQINYAKIFEAAADMRKNALRLDSNLFGAKSDKTDKKTEDAESKSVRDLIIELDTAIGEFVSSPIFQDTKVVDLTVSEKAQLELKKIIKLSQVLSKEAEKMK